MKQGRIETVTTRIVSITFVVVALAVFKPFGLDAWQWQAYVHLGAMWVIGFVVCMIADGLLRHVVRMPRAYDKGAEYIIRRNLWFQLINTPLVSWGICLYRHFAMSNRVEANHLSLANFLETLVVIGFCSFAIGLYWRFKFRSRYLAAELEETRLLNEQLQMMQQTASSAPVESLAEAEGSEHPQPTDGEKTLTGTTNETVTLRMADLLYVEAVGNYVKVYQLCGGKVRTDMLRATSKQIEDELRDDPRVIRCHRAFLVNLGQVDQVVSRSGTMQLLMKHCHDSIPVSRSNMTGVKEAIKKASSREPRQDL